MIYYLTRYYILGSVYNLSFLKKAVKPPLYFCNNQMTESSSIIRA